MNFHVDGFDWDDGNRSKCQKHGMSIAEIEALFLRGARVALTLGGRGSFDRSWGNRQGKAAIRGFYDAYK
jgi:hypothetical protein